MSAHPRRLGTAMLVTVVLAWGLVWPANKVILESLSPSWMAALRSGIAAVALIVFSAALRRLTVPRRADMPVLLSITLLHMVGFVLLTTVGLQLVSTGRSVVLAYTTPLWVAPGAWLFLGEPLTRRRIAGVIVGLLGLVVLFNPLAFDWSDRAAVLGNLAILGGAALWAGSILHVRGHRWQGTPFELVPWELLLATVILAPAAYVWGGELAVSWDARLVSLLLYSSIPGTALAYWAVAMAGRLLPAVTTSLGLLATPVVSMIIAGIWLGEAPTASLLIGIALILGGVAIGAAAPDVLASSAMAQITPAVRTDLAPTGKLRAAINYGNFILAKKDPATGESSGAAIDLAREVAQRLGVPLEIIAYDLVGVMVDAAPTGAWDVAFCGSEPARETVMSFTAAYLEIEATYLVKGDSPLRNAADVDREGVRVAAPARANYELFLKRTIQRAALTSTQGGEAAFELLRTGNVDALAGLTQGLLALAAKFPGSRLLEGRFMGVQQSIGVPKGRDAGLAYLRSVVEDAKQSGLVARAIQKTGARGVSVAPPAK